MLAVVFWNSRNASATDVQYEDALSGFHKELNQRKSKGLRRSVAFAVRTELPWLCSDFRIYEDWYIMTNFAALDDLDRLVIEGKHLPSHRELMTKTGCASGAVMYLDKGVPFVERCRNAYWFSKPRGTTADDIAEIAIDSGSPKSISVWTRAMALGPAGSCILANEAIEFPPDYEVTETVRDVLWAP
jgi:hypothetical protein